MAKIIENVELWWDTTKAASRFVYNGRETAEVIAFRIVDGNREWHDALIEMAIWDVLSAHVNVGDVVGLTGTLEVYEPGEKRYYHRVCANGYAYDKGTLKGVKPTGYKPAPKADSACPWASSPVKIRKWEEIPIHGVYGKGADGNVVEFH